MTPAFIKAVAAIAVSYGLHAAPQHGDVAMQLSKGKAVIGYCAPSKCRASSERLFHSSEFIHLSYGQQYCVEWGNK